MGELDELARAARRAKIPARKKPNQIAWAAAIMLFVLACGVGLVLWGEHQTHLQREQRELLRTYEARVAHLEAVDYLKKSDSRFAETFQGAAKDTTSSLTDSEQAELKELKNRIGQLRANGVKPAP